MQFLDFISRTALQISIKVKLHQLIEIMQYPASSELIRDRSFVFISQEMLKGVFVKKSILIATNSTSICCVYKEKMVLKNVINPRAKLPYKYTEL